MKAAQSSRFGRPEVIRIVELPDRHPGVDEIGEGVSGVGIVLRLVPTAG